MILLRHFLVFAFFPLLLLGCGASSVPIGITFSHRNLVYHGGAVMHHVTAYATFWFPKPYHFEPSGNDAAYQHLVEQFLKDVGGTSYYRILTQYSYAAHHRAVAGGPILNRLRFGGAYTDRTPFPRPGTVAHPLKRDDWENELLRVLNHTPWNPGPNALFILFLPANINVCYDASTCTFDTGNGARDCGLHSAFGVTSHRRTFSVVDIILPDSFSVNDPAMCAPLDQDHSPNHDVVADSEVVILSHELFEAVTDPGTDQQGGWYEAASTANEITDKCNALRGTIALHRHPYIVQEQWSNADRGCVLTPSK